MQKEDARKQSREVLHERRKEVLRMHWRARYIHVQDLAQGHVAALQSLSDKGESFTVNMGTGQGHSVLEVVRAFEQASGRPVPYQFARAALAMWRSVMQIRPWPSGCWAGARRTRWRTCVRMPGVGRVAIQRVMVRA